MKIFSEISRTLKWSLALLLVALAAGCGSSQNPILGGGGAGLASTKAITTYAFAGYPGSAGTINEPAKTITVNLPSGSLVTALVANFTTTGTSVKIGAAVQTSAVTANDFTNPVTYIVTAADGTTATYTVTVTLSPITAKAITAYSFAGYPGQSGFINEAATPKTIAVNLPSGTSVTALVANFTTTGTSVMIGAAVQTSGTTTNDFTTQVTYRVTAADTTFVDYVVTVTVAPTVSADKAISTYSFVGYPGFPGVINELAVPKTIAVNLPSGTPVTDLVAKFTTTGTSVKIGAAVQTSGTTANIFTNPVAYIVTAADGTTATYNVTVTLASNTAKAITAYSFVGYPGFPGVITESAVPKTITVNNLPSGTDVTTLVANFTTTGTGVKIGAVVQTSGTTLNNFSSPVTYTVTAADSTTANYVVTVTVAAAPLPPPVLAINLGSAATFGIASRAGMTSTGVTVINGDVALSPTATCTDSTGNVGASQTCLVKTYSSPTGMTVNGSIYFAGDPFDGGATANKVSNDLNVAWVEGKNKIDTFATGFLLGELGAPGPAGKVLLPGVYHEAALGLAAGNVVTFDAQNNANAIFIIKVDSSFTDSGTLLLPTQIKLVNGALARNVWFVAGLDITIGSGTIWNGNILAGRTATVLDGSTVIGRVLAGATGAGAITITGAASPSVTTITVPQ